MKKIFEEQVEILYISPKGKQLKLIKGDILNIHIVLDLDVEVLEDGIIAKNHRITRKEIVSRKGK